MTVAPPGRNDVCPCGSGKKYKKCCLDRDAEAARAAAPPQPPPPAYRADERRPATPFDRARLRVWFHLLDRLSEEEVERLEEAWRGPATDGPSAFEDLEEQLEGWLDDAFHDAASLDQPLLAGRTAAERVLEKEADRIPADERRYVRALSESFVDLYEVVEVRPGEGLGVASVFRPERVFVRERLGSQQIVRSDLLVARVIDPGDHSEFATVCHTPRMYKQALVEWFERDAAAPDRTTAQSLKLEGAKLVRELVRLVREPKPPPKLVTPEGDPLCLSRAEYRIVDRPRLLEALERARDVEPLGPSSARTLEFGVLHEPGRKRGGHAGAGEDSRAGRVEVRVKKAVIEALSRERLERVRRVFEAAAGDAAQFEAERIETAETAMRRRRGGARASAPADEVPREVQAQALEQFLERHYETWPGTPLPALEGRTPREAARDPRLKPRLVELLKDLEQGEGARRRDLGYGYDVDRIRRRLGLET